jgi:hypothetical protein
MNHVRIDVRAAFTETDAYFQIGHFFENRHGASP